MLTKFNIIKATRDELDLVGDVCSYSMRKTSRTPHIEIIELRWAIICLIHSSEIMINNEKIDNILTQLPTGIKKIIEEYFTDLWTVKSDPDHNNTSFLTKSIDRNVMHWYDNVVAMCKICHGQNRRDSILFKFINVEPEVETAGSTYSEAGVEYIVTTICIECLSNITLEEIGLIGYERYNWLYMIDCGYGTCTKKYNFKINHGNLTCSAIK
jgi:hypothetical protein